LGEERKGEEQERICGQRVSAIRLMSVLNLEDSYWISKIATETEGGGEEWRNRYLDGYPS